MAATGEDPRLLRQLEPEVGSVRPIVSKPRAGPSSWVLIGGLLALAVLLFVILDSRRRELNAPVTDSRIATRPVLTTAPPPLIIPPAKSAPQPVQAIIAPPVAARPVAIRPAPPTRPQIIYVPQTTPVQPTPTVVTPEAPVRPPSSTPALVIDAGANPSNPVGRDAADTPGPSSAVPSGPTTGNALTGGRARAGMLANRATTIPQGMLIPAVLETALDTSRPGIARAVVSRDVRGFDGTRILVPRGSRLIGEYRSDVTAGQRRAMIEWTRLIRPDGATIALGSPAGDPLGRGGVGARARGNFLSRFLGSFLQSALDVGVALAGGRNQQTVIVADRAATGLQILQPEQVTRSLTVRPGTSISVLVSRDLDFTTVENSQ